MKIIDALVLAATVAGAFGLGITYDAHRIQSTCESDEATTVINGTTYVCLSPRHIEMIRRQQGRAV